MIIESFKPQLLESLILTADVKGIIIYGTNEEAKALHDEFKKNGKSICYFVDDIVLADTFDGMPLRSVYDLIFEDLSDKFIVQTQWAHTLMWSKHTAILLSLGLKLFDNFATILKPPVLIGVDAHLGHNHLDGELPGFKVWGDINNPDALRIFTLGGSTSDPFMSVQSDFYSSWSELLYKRLRSFQTDVVVVGGGCIMHKSSQELMKLIRDVLPLKPNLVITYGGVNDIFSDHESQNWIATPNRFQRPMLSRSTDTYFSVTSKTFFENAQGRDRDYLDTTQIGYGVRNPQSGGDFWLENMRIMHCIAQEFSFAFLGILQPCLYTLNDSRVFPQLIKSYQVNELFGDWFRAEIEQLREKIRSYPYLLDYSDAYDACCSYLYCDDCHVLPRANAIIAEKIHQDLIRLNLWS